MATPEQTALAPEQTALTPDKQERQVDLEASKPMLDKPKVSEITDKIKKPTVQGGLGTFAVLNFIMFVVGCATTTDCPVQNIIPVYLIVAGAVGIVSKLLPVYKLYKDSQLLDLAITIVFLFEFIWMILGSYWVYSIYTPNYNPGGSELHCNKTAYLLAFWLLTLNYIFLVLLIVIPCCVGCCILCFAICTTSKE